MDYLAHQLSSFSNWQQALAQLFFLISRCVGFNCITFVHHFLFNSCPALLCVLSNSSTTWASCSASVLIENIPQSFRTFSTRQLILFCWNFGPCCVLLVVAFHGLPTYRLKNFKSRALSPSRRLTQRVFVAPVAVKNKDSSVRSSLPTKTPRIHLMFNVAPSSEWFRPKHTSPNGTTSPVQDDKEVSRLPSLGNCFQPIHKVVPSSPSKHDQVQLLSCTPWRRLLEMPQVVPESSMSLVLSRPKLLSEAFGVAVTIRAVG